jgi:hypothetical protein
MWSLMQHSHLTSSTIALYSRRTHPDEKFTALFLVMTFLLKALEMYTFGFLLLDSIFVSACEIVGMFRPRHTIFYLVQP